MIHPKIQFLFWPKVVDDLNPFNKICDNVNHKLRYELNDLKKLYVSWYEMREDFDNFHCAYDKMHSDLQKIVENGGNYIQE